MAKNTVKNLNISNIGDTYKNNILRRRNFMNNNQAEVQIHQSFMDDVITESMEDMGNYRLSNFPKKKFTKIIDEFLDDIIKEAEDDYKAGITYGIGNKK